jgi:hypothetical protein
MAVAIWRATRRLLLPRLILTLGTAVAVVAVVGVTPLLTMAIAFVGLLIIVIVEQRAVKPI